MARCTWRLAALLVALVSIACYAPGGKPAPRNVRQFVGTWRFVSGTYTPPNGEPQRRDSTELQLLKVVGPTHFAYVTQAAGARFVRAGAGTFTVANGKYSETIALTSVDNMRGQTYSFDYRFDQDTWYQSGMIDKTRIEEVYRRVK